jgi:hypothetical protein
MSEFSCSFHVRTHDAAETEAALGRARMSGLVFGPANGWLTFVPYPRSDGLRDAYDDPTTAAAIATATGQTVLQFQFADDHGWFVALVGPDRSMSTFSDSWDHDPPDWHDRFDRSALAGVDQFLVPARAADDGRANAFGFADALGLPAYRWLSPRYIDKDAQRFIDAGARRIGRKPAEPRTTRLPAPAELALPKPDPTARAALGLLAPMMDWYRPPWTLRLVSGSSRQGWDFWFHNADLQETVQGYLFPNGHAGFSSRGHDPVTEARSATLPAQWIDSDAVVKIAEKLEIPPELEGGALRRFLSLQWWRREPQARWNVMATSDDASNRISWTVELDAQTGEVLRETLSRPGQGRNSWIITPWRERIAGGPWRDLQKGAS